MNEWERKGKTFILALGAFLLQPPKEQVDGGIPEQADGRRIQAAKVELNPRHKPLDGRRLHFLASKQYTTNAHMVEIFTGTTGVELLEQYNE